MALCASMHNFLLPVASNKGQARAAGVDKLSGGMLWCMSCLQVAASRGKLLQFTCVQDNKVAVQCKGYVHLHTREATVYCCLKGPHGVGRCACTGSIATMGTYVGWVTLAFKLVRPALPSHRKGLNCSKVLALLRPERP